LIDFFARGRPLVGAAAVDGALDVEQRIEASERLQRDRSDTAIPQSGRGAFR